MEKMSFNLACHCWLDSRGRVNWDTTDRQTDLTNLSELFWMWRFFYFSEVTSESGKGYCNLF